MASAQFNADQSHDQAEAKTEQWVESANTAANSSVNKIEDAIQRARESAQQKREQNSGFLHQTGEQMMHMAQGAVDGGEEHTRNRIEQKQMKVKITK